MPRLPELSGRAILAPMAGVSDPALRLLCRRAGAALVSTELTSVHGVVAKARQLEGRGLDISEFIRFSEEERPVSVQLFGSDAGALAEAARIVSPFFDAIDYNMGCPAPHITAQMAGGALLQEPGITRRALRALVGASRRPVTLKMRAGASEAGRRRFLEVARIAEEEGVSMLTLHARTVEQGYAGRSDWSLIRELVRASGLPVAGNGDVRSPEDAARMIGETGCDYVMVGRAAMGNPLIFGQINDYLRGGSYRRHGAAERARAFAEYAELAGRMGVPPAAVRRQALRFVSGARGAARLRRAICGARSGEEVLRAVACAA